MSRAEIHEPRRVRAMFDGIARRYDLLNHVLSAGADRRWRRRAAAEVPPGDGGAVLDLCGGTGDLALALAAADPRRVVVCCDFSHAMLTRAAAKFLRRGAGAVCLPVEADALRLPFAGGRFDAVTVAFGVRNLAELDEGIREIHRVLRPGGRLVVLEFSQPPGRTFGALYRFYLRRFLPRLGDAAAGRSGPYGYLARTIQHFPQPAHLAGRIREAGFAACGWRTMSGGIVAIHTAFRSP